MTLIVQIYILAFLGYIILSRSIKDIRSDILLKEVMFLLVYAGVLRLALGLDLQLPFVFHESVFWAYALFVPGAYLCLRNHVYGRKLKEKDLVHLVPFLMVVVCSVLVSLAGTGVQLEIRQSWSFTTEIAHESTMLMPLFLFIYCLTAFYSYQVILLFKNTVLKKQELIQQESIVKPPMDGVQAEKAAAHQTLIISEERMIEIDKIVKEVLDLKKPYLQQRYSLKDLARDTNIPLHHLSAFVNKYCGKNFNDFINEFRVLFCKEKLLNEEYKYKKLEAIAEESGFNNRNTFAIAFKKVMGLKPSEFLRNLKSVDDAEKSRFEITPPQEYLQRV